MEDNIKVKIKSKDNQKCLRTQLYEFYLKNNYLIYATVITLLLSYTIEINNFSLSIDEEMWKDSLVDYFWIGQNRSGTYFLNIIFNVMGTFSPGFTTIISIFFFAIGSLFWCFLLQRRFGAANGGKWRYILFSILYLTFPIVTVTNMSFSMHSIPQQFVQMLIPVSVYFAEEYNLYKCKNYLLTSGFILGFTLTVYQSMGNLFLLYWIGVVFIAVFIYENPFFSTLKTDICTPIIIIVISIITYKVINLCFQTALNVEISEYLNSFAWWKQHDSIMSHIKISTRITKNLLLSRDFLGNSIYGLQTMTISVVIFFFVSILYLIKKIEYSYKFLFKIFLIIGFIISPFSIIFLIGSVPIRSMQSLNLYIGLLWFCIITMTTYCFDKKKSSYGVWVIAFYLCYVQLYQVNVLFYGEHLRYNLDVALGHNIMSKVNDLDYNSEVDKIVFIGTYSHTSKQIKRVENIGASFFEWDFGNNHRIGNFLQLNGYDIQMPDTESVHKAYDNSINMPAWPSKHSVMRVDNIIIVKLSEPSEWWFGPQNNW